ncbi:MAG: hypothetical protein COB38_02200 [Gammaproteobacteria bacterium]|nr:MAG: hypothetical protein COB38_02200 [Gammaproteobacteria bacterium]
MKTNQLKLFIAMLFVVFLSSCAGSFKHDYLMKGQVIDVKDNDDIVVCVGTDDGAKVGQMLNVYRFIERHPDIESPDQYARVDVGKVVIEEIVNEHYAIAKIIDGSIEKYDTVQLVSQ